MPFRIALSGLDAASTDLEVTGNNIANAATNGFKTSRAEFSDIYANSLQDVSATAAGRGVKVSRVAQQFSQGNVEFTQNNLDLAINGEGFFVLEDAGGNVSYTRAGAYSVDRDGYVVNSNGEQLQVFAPISPGSAIFNTGATTSLQLPTLSGSPQSTTEVNASLNLEADGTVIANTQLFDPNLPSTYQHSTSTTVYDSLGSAHTMTMYYRESSTTANQWYVFTTLDGNMMTPSTNPVTTDPASVAYPAAVMNFTPGGLLDTTVGTDSVDGNGRIAYDAFDLSAVGAGDLTLEFDYSDASQFGSAFSVNDLTQNGYAPGRLSGIDFDNTGVVSARFTNGQSLALGKVALAKFNNSQGLRQLGDTSWAETFTSGDAQLGEAATSSFGLIQSGGLENSNVDIAEQLVNLITAQRNFQANAQVITAGDTITQTIINIR
jgi:flagellar hook protein FlgE